MADDKQPAEPFPRPAQQPIWVPDQMSDPPPIQMRRNNALYDLQPPFVPPPLNSPARNIPASGASLGPAVTLQAELTLTGKPVTVGKMVIVNRDAILIQAKSIELLLRDVIDREKEARSNSGSLPELGAILGEIHDLQAALATAASEPAVGTMALLFKKGVLDWWDKDHVSILTLGYKSCLFVLLMGLIVYFGLIPATIAGTLINKDVGEALKQLVKLLRGGESGDGPA